MKWVGSGSYLLDDDSQDQTGIDLRLGGNLQDGIVNRTLFRTSVGMDEEGLLVQVEHGGEVHPVGECREVLLDTLEADVVVRVGVTVVANGQAGSIPLETISSNYRPNSAEDVGAKDPKITHITHANRSLRTLTGDDYRDDRDDRADRAGSNKSQERRDSEDLTVVS